MKNFASLFLLAFLAMNLTACTRPRLRNNEPLETVTAASSSAAAPQPSPTALEVIDSATHLPSATPLPVMAEPSTTKPPAAPPTQVQPSAAATLSTDLDAALNELEQLLGGMDTNVNVP